MTKKRNQYALVVHYSFDYETPVYLFISFQEAIAELRRQFSEEVRIDEEENGRGGPYYETEITEDGTFAQIRIKHTDIEDDVTTWHVDTVRERPKKSGQYFSAYNRPEDFRVLVLAKDSEDAFRLLKSYSEDSSLENEWELSEHLRGRYDCDYVIEEEKGHLQNVEDVPH